MKRRKASYARINDELTYQSLGRHFEVPLLAETELIEGERNRIRMEEKTREMRVEPPNRVRETTTNE